MHEFQPGDPACGPQGDCDIVSRVDDDHYVVQYECVRRVVQAQYLHPYPTEDEIWGSKPKYAKDRKPGVVDLLQQNWSKSSEYHHKIGRHPDDPLPQPIYPSDIFGLGDVQEDKQQPERKKRKTHLRREGPE